MLDYARMPPKRSGGGLRVAFAAGVAAVLAFGSPAWAQDNDAKAAEQNRQEASDIVRGMAKYIGGQKEIEIQFDTTLEVVSPQLEKLQFNSSGKAQISRPDQFRVSRTGGYADVELIYDGKTITVFDRNANTYASEPMTGSIDEVVDTLRDAFRLDLPAADLLITDSYNALMADVVDAKHVGMGVIDNVACEHVAFRNNDTDWQLWVETGAQPIPCKLVITSKAVTGSPQYTVLFTDWENGDDFPPGTFTFTPPAGAKQVDFKTLSDIDELPSRAMTGDAK